jgi:hypothetical protein
MPPSSTRVCPVMNPALVHTHTTASATSWAVAMRFSGMLAAISAGCQSAFWAAVLARAGVQGVLFHGVCDMKAVTDIQRPSRKMYCCSRCHAIVK